MPTAGDRPTNKSTDAGTPVFLRERPCAACGCFQAFEFRCGCGKVHSDVCYNCGGFVDVPHKPIEEQNEGLSMWWAGRCEEGPHEHTHRHPFKDELPPRKAKGRR